MRFHIRLPKYCAALGLAFAAGALPAAGGILTGVSLSVSNPAPSAHSNVALSFTIQTQLVSSDNLVQAQFPAGFVFTAGNGQAFCDANIAISLNGTPTNYAALAGGGLGFCGTFGFNLLQIVVTTTIPAGTQVVITISSAIETNPGTTGAKSMLFLQTATAGGAPIDTPGALPMVTIAAPSITNSAPTLSFPLLVALGVLLIAAGARRLQVPSSNFAGPAKTPLRAGPAASLPRRQ